MRTRRYGRRVATPLEDRAAAPAAGAWPWLVYVLTDEAHARFSISMAKDAEARAERHRELAGPHLRQRTPLLVRVERYADRHTAIARMKRLRRWAYPALRTLIEDDNPQWQDLCAPSPDLRP